MWCVLVMGDGVLRVVVLTMVMSVCLPVAFAAGDGKETSNASFFDHNYAKSPFFDPAEEAATPSPTPAEAAPDKVVQEFGDPSLDPPLNVAENAPKPFKAFMAAMEGGDKKLAFQYAKQYARYMKRLQGRLSDVVGMVGMAQEREGLVGPEDWQSSPQFNQYRYLLREDLKEDDLKLDPELAVKAEKRKLERARMEFLERGKARQKLAGKVPVDAKKKVDLLLFFEPDARFTPQMLAEIDELARAYSADKRVRVSSYYVGNAALQDPERFKKENDITFSVKQDTLGLVKQFNIKQLPAVVVVSPSSGQGVIEEGFRRAPYLDEVMRMMQGLPEKVVEGLSEEVSG